MIVADPTSKEEVFAHLKAILQIFVPPLVVSKDDPENHYLDTVHTMRNRQPLFFGAVMIKKSYVSFHLMPVYACPTLLEGMSDALKARMQGKACFNFKKVETALFEELTQLARASFDRFQDRDMLEKFGVPLKQE